MPATTTTLGPAAVVFATLGFGWPGFAVLAPGLGVDVSAGAFLVRGFGIGASAEFELGPRDGGGEISGRPSLRLAGLVHSVIDLDPVRIIADISLGLAARRPLSVGYWLIDGEAQWRYASARLDFTILGRAPAAPEAPTTVQLGPWLRLDAEFLPVLDVLHRDGGADERTPVARLRTGRVMGGIHMAWTHKDGPGVDLKMAVGALRLPSTTGVDFVVRLGFSFQGRS